MYKHIILTEQEMAALDDGQEWYEAGDTVTLEGYLPESEDDNPAFGISVNGEHHDNWMHWSDTPDDIKHRLQVAK